jgi:L-lactate dehydrogenase complex protein LldG
MELESELREGMKSAPRYVSFISGASRTADIERVLTIGVHGPQELHLLILDDQLTGEES